MPYSCTTSNRVPAMHICLVVALISLCGLLLLAATGCGPSDEERIQQALSQQFDAIKAKDDATVSSLLSEDASGNLKTVGIDPGEFTSAFLDGFDYSLGSISVDKDTASVDVTITCKTLSQVNDQLTQYARDDYDSGNSANSTEDEIQDDVAQRSLEAIAEAPPIQHDAITVTLHKQDNSWVVDPSINGAIAKTFQG